eukprot:193129-Pyramimonas_sp.AAC.1
MQKGVAVGDRMYHFHKYKNVFTGHDVVKWMMRVDPNTQKALVANHEAALALGNRMRKAGLIEHVTNEHIFQDAELFYRR